MTGNNPSNHSDQPSLLMRAAEKFENATGADPISLGAFLFVSGVIIACYICQVIARPVARVSSLLKR